MADKKISALTAASTPLAGTEVLPIVQSGSTVKVSVDNLTYGKTVTVQSLKLEKVGTFAGSGFLNANQFVSLAVNNGSVDQFYINQSASQGALEITSDSNLKVLSGKGIDFSANGGDVLSQYDEGTWTPVVTASAGSITSYTSSGRFTRVGRMVTAVLTFKITNVGTASGAIIATLPSSTDAAITYIGAGRDDNTGNMVQGRVQSAVPGSVYFATYANATIAATNTEVFFSIQYFV